MNDKSDNPWGQLTHAARQAPPAQLPVAPTPRVREIRRRVLALVRAILWRRVSLVLALLAVLAWLVISLLIRSVDPQPTLIPLPPDALQEILKP